MFMSTRYKKKPVSSARQKSLFTVDDSLAKLFEFLTAEFSHSKLITPKWKDFRSQKLEFDQKTRLNNAIWRAWHIQYKMHQKARFFQFAAPFSDETVHSTSQAVILEGKYWKRRLDAVSKEFKTWRKMYKEKLLRSEGLNKEELETSEEEVFVDEYSNAVNSATPFSLCNSSAFNNFDTWSAVSALSDTFFSSVKNQKPNENLLTSYKDSSVMIQPTIDHLNPCFDELTENFDFLFSDWNSNSTPQQQQAELLIPTNEHLHGSFHNEFFSRKNNDNTSYASNHNIHAKKNDADFLHQIPQNPTVIAPKADPFPELSPRLQAPNLTAHLQATLSSQPTIITESPVKRKNSVEEFISTKPKKFRMMKNPTDSIQKPSQNVVPIFPKITCAVNNVTTNSSTFISSILPHSVATHPGFQVVPRTLDTSTTVFSPGSKQVLTPNLNQILQNQNTLLSTSVQPSDQQLLTLASILQCSQSTQSTEDTLTYLELLQKQLQLLLKQQQEQVQMKLQIQQHAEKVMRLRGSPHTTTMQHVIVPQVAPSPISTLAHHHSLLSLPSSNVSIAPHPPSIKRQSSMPDDHAQDGAQKLSLDELQNSKRHSLIRTLHRKLDYNPREISFHEASKCSRHSSVTNMPAETTTSGSQRTEVTEDHSWRPSTTLDSAMALVALQLGRQPIKISDPSTSKETTPDEALPSMPESQVEFQENQGDLKEERRKIHLSAEQKRRGVIKNAFLDLSRLIPAVTENRGNKLSNAAILQRAYNYIVELKEEKMAYEMTTRDLKDEIERAKSRIAECQGKLHDVDSVDVKNPKASENVEESFVSYCKELIYTNPKSWIFCILMRPLFKSFNASVDTSTVDQFVSTVMIWAEKYCTLSSIRTIVLNTFTKLSTNTSLLDDPSCISDLVEGALEGDDPTEIPDHRS